MRMDTIWSLHDVVVTHATSVERYHTGSVERYHTLLLLAVFTDLVSHFHQQLYCCYSFINSFSVTLASNLFIAMDGHLNQNSHPNQNNNGATHGGGGGRRGHGSNTKGPRRIASLDWDRHRNNPKSVGILKHMIHSGVAIAPTDSQQQQFLRDYPPPAPVPAPTQDTTSNVSVVAFGSSVSSGTGSSGTAGSSVSSGTAGSSGTLVGSSATGTGTVTDFNTHEAYLPAGAKEVPAHHTHPGQEISDCQASIVPSRSSGGLIPSVAVLDDHDNNTNLSLHVSTKPAASTSSGGHHTEPGGPATTISTTTDGVVPTSQTIYDSQNSSPINHGSNNSTLSGSLASPSGINPGTAHTFNTNGNSWASGQYPGIQSSGTPYVFPFGYASASSSYGPNSSYAPYHGYHHKMSPHPILFHQPAPYLPMSSQFSPGHFSSSGQFSPSQSGTYGQSSPLPTASGHFLPLPTAGGHGPGPADTGYSFTGSGPPAAMVPSFSGMAVHSPAGVFSNSPGLCNGIPTPTPTPTTPISSSTNTSGHDGGLLTPAPANSSSKRGKKRERDSKSSSRKRYHRFSRKHRSSRKHRRRRSYDSSDSDSDYSDSSDTSNRKGTPDDHGYGDKATGAPPNAKN